MKFEHTRTMNWEGALRGMRNPMNSHSKADSITTIVNVSNKEDIVSYEKDCGKVCIAPNADHPVYAYTTFVRFPFAEVISIGENDLKLAQQLIRAGSEHRKFMRQIFVSVDITAPMYWWAEFDTYKIGTVANSTSKMHKVASTPMIITVVSYIM